MDTTVSDTLLIFETVGSSNFGLKRDTVVLLRGERNTFLGSKLVNSQPLCIHKQKIKPFPLAEIRDIRIQEALIIKDLLYVLLGLEGSYIRYSEKYDPQIERLRLAGPDYKINKHLDPSLKDVTKRIVLLAKMFASLSSFTEIYDAKPYGQVIQSFVFEIRRYLKSYVLFIDNIHVQFWTNKGFTLRQLEQDLMARVSYKMTHLYEITQTILETNAKRRNNTQETAFGDFINSIKIDLKTTGSVDLVSDSSSFTVVKGGLALKIVQDRLDDYSGDLKSFDFLSDLLNDISTNYVVMLNDWITKGDINDSNDEFFITTNLPPDFKVNSLNSERYWDSKYVIKKDGLPKQFQNKETQLKVLLTGKFLNVLKICGVSTDRFSLQTVSSLNSSQLNLVIDHAYKVANEYLIELFFKGYDFRGIIHGFESLFMMSNASKIFHFLELSFSEFKKDFRHASTSRFRRNFAQVFKEQNHFIFQLLNLRIEREPIYSYLQDILKVEVVDADQALGSNNLESIKDLISKALDVKKDMSEEQKSVEGLRATNYFNLDLILPFPINLVLTRTVVIQYQLIFRHLLNLHFTDKLLSDTWLEINKNKIWKHRGFEKPIAKWISRARSLHDRMKDFIRLYFGYVTNDLIEYNWREFSSRITNLSEFEQISSLLQSFLNTILKSSILTTDKLIKIYSRLSQIVNAFCTFLLSLRKVLILLDYDLFEKYNERLKDKEFDHGKNLERLGRLNSYLEEYLDSFGQHLNGFIEGLRYYGELETSDFLILAIKLEESYPASNGLD